MRTTICLVLLAVAAGCTRDDQMPAPPSATTHPASVSTRSVAAPAPPAPAGIATPASAAASPGDDFEWDLATEPEGTDFEIDAAATTYYAPAPAQISFKAKALNGTPPVTFTWTFGDGSPNESGEMVSHTFSWVGLFTVIVVGKDAQGHTSQVSLILRTATPEEFVARMRLDPEQAKLLPSPAPSPQPSATPQK